MSESQASFVGATVTVTDEDGNLVVGAPWRSGAHTGTTDERGQIRLPTAEGDLTIIAGAGPLTLTCSGEEAFTTSAEEAS